MRRVSIALLALVAVVAGCRDSATPTTTATTSTTATPTTTSTTAVVLQPESDAIGTRTTGELVFGSMERTYRLYVPSDLPSGPRPLFLALHGGFGWGDQFAQTDHIERLAESNGFLVVHPDGVRITPDAPSAVWNGGMCCGPSARLAVDDVGFLDAVITEVSEGHDVDPQRVYAFGHSNGGIMSYRLACELADRIVGIGAVAGTLGIDDCTPAQPVSVIHVHGTADENLPLVGGVGPRSVAGVTFPPPRDGFATLASAAGCTDPADTVDGDLTLDVRTPCAAGAEAVFVTIAGANHAWPGGTPIVTPAFGPGYERYDATAEIVTFLLAHPRPT